MSATDHYFTFPLAVLQGTKDATTAVDCLELAVRCGVVNAGIGFRKKHTDDEYRERLDEVIEKQKITFKVKRVDIAHVLVGAALCNVSLGGTGLPYYEAFANDAESVVTGGPLVKMSSTSLWAATYQARWEADTKNPHPERGMSWREFRILAAILSIKTNRFGFCFVGWETIQSRSCGFATKEAFDAAKTIPDHLAPPPTRKQIRTTCDTLEVLGFYARFRMSSGARGGLTAYSFRHKDREELGNAVCEHINFRDRASIKTNRAKDAEKCLALLERAKVGPSQGQQ